MTAALRAFALFFFIPAFAARAGEVNPAEVLAQFDAYPHAVSVNQSRILVKDYEIGLGAIQKRRGNWIFKHSERRSGELQRYTWQITDGFTANEILQELVVALEGLPVLFSCEGRGCGPGVQWANRVFKERVLYGRDDLQRYRVYGPDESAGEDYRLLLFSSSRTEDRQYLHAELLSINGQSTSE